MLDYATVDALRTLHPAWRLLRSDHAALIASFLHRVFVAPNVRAMAAADLTEAREDELYGLREKLGAEAFPKPALDYLNEWAGTDKGWLRKFYRTGSVPRATAGPGGRRAPGSSLHRYRPAAASRL